MVRACPTIAEERRSSSCRTVRGAFGEALGDVRKRLAALVVQIQAIRGFGEPQVGVHAGNDYSSVDGQELDPHDRNSDEHVDDQAFVEDERDDVREAARATAPCTLDVIAAA